MVNRMRVQRKKVEKERKSVRVCLAALLTRSVTRWWPCDSTFVGFFFGSNGSRLQNVFGAVVSTIMLLVYVVSRLLLLVEAFVSLRHLTPGMLALVKWTSFIPHI